MHNGTKHQYIAVAAFLFLTLACAKQERISIPGNRIPITFRESTDGTKSILSGEDIPESYTIYASACFTNSGDTDCSRNYFVSKPYRKNAGLWSASPAVYWPIGRELDFLFIACEDTAIDIQDRAVWNAGNCTKGVELNVPDGACLNSEILFASTLGRTSREGSIPVRFKHAQNWLQFIIDSNADIVRIDSIVIGKVYTGGTFRVSNDLYLDAEWSFRNNLRGNLTVPGSEGLIISSGTPAVCNILIPEQDACDISLYYSVNAVSSVFRHKAGADPCFYGKKNILQISFAFSEITIKSTVKDWEDDSSDILIH